MAQTNIRFQKFQGAGNDFIMIDNRDGHFNTLSEDKAFTSWMCDRNFGIGADGILEVRTKSGYDFEMVYTREEGNKGPYLCGNGSRCIVSFAHHINVPRVGEKYSFLAKDGPHIGWFDESTQKAYVKFKDIDGIKKYDHNNMYIHVGNERHCTFVDNLWEMDVIEEGRKLGYQEMYMDKRQGMNVMFIKEESDDSLGARSFEARIDYEPLACGTGAVASALVCEFRKDWTVAKTGITTPVAYKGGKVEIMYDVPEAGKFENVYLIGPAKKTFEGHVNVADFPSGYQYKYNTK